MRALTATFAVLVLGTVYCGTAGANPPNSTARGITWQCNPGYSRVGYQCRPNNIISQPPKNAVGQGAHWYCKPGYRKVAGQCIKAQDPPANASVNAISSSTGLSEARRISEPLESLGAQESRRVTTWECDPGYERIGNQCQRLPTPPNAFRVGTGWNCYKGYQRVEDQCQKIDTPN
jgi:hypothetical protein